MPARTRSTTTIHLMPPTVRARNETPLMGMRARSLDAHTVAFLADVRSANPTCPRRDRRYGAGVPVTAPVRGEQRDARPARRAVAAAPGPRQRGAAAVAP